MAELQELERAVLQQTDELGHSRDPKTIMLFLMEELGEATRAYLKENGYKETNNRVAETFKQELGDVMLLLLRLSAVTGTDLEAMLKRTMEKLAKAQEEV
jgi:NTP pyrophosphatase (non-canonical NTP hydrolase)